MKQARIQNVPRVGGGGAESGAPDCRERHSLNHQRDLQCTDAITLGQPLKMATQVGEESVAQSMPVSPAIVEAAVPATQARSLSKTFSLYVALMKPGILTLLLVTTLGAMFVAQNGVPELSLVIVT